MAKVKFKTDEDFKKAKEQLKGAVDLRKRKDGRNIAAKHPLSKKKRK